MACSKIVSERQRHGKRQFRLDLSNGMRIAALTTVADDSPTMLNNGLTQQRGQSPRARTNGISVISALPF
ncbi:hypothetical protein, partial [Cupriavidus pinatubonensis]